MAFLSIKQSYDDYHIDLAVGQASGGNNSYILARKFRR
jgi:hypothetical protein